MLILEKRKSKKKQKELGGGANLRRTFSNTSAPTKVQINIEDVKEKLLKLLQEYENIKDLAKLYTDLCTSLNIYNCNTYNFNSPSSHYGVFELEIDDNSKTFSIRVSNHSVNCSNYVTHNTNMDFNLSLIINNKRINKKRFIPDDRVGIIEDIHIM